ncbi:hypothetical protein, partial [Methylacidiphilum caldifontis]|uniref:hypothetical protein n=1 Tax=Methylacidiphilum caldifontis TaxID=2795386 RepID=UPI001ABC269E
AGGRKQEPTEATQERCHATPERRRNLRPSGRGGCQFIKICFLRDRKSRPNPKQGVAALYFLIFRIE